MTDNASPVIERHCDVAVIGGSAAGLAAALQLGRQRRSVIVIDDGRPRNAPAAHVHGFLGRDGTPPADLLADGRADVHRYGGEILPSRAGRVSRTEDDRFRVELADGNRVVARRVIAATGIVDELPPIPGLAEHWRRDVIHCPFCHGYEVRDRRIVLILTHPMGLHPAALFRQLTEHLTVVLHEPSGVDEAQLDALRAGGVDVRPGPVGRIVSGADGRLTGVELADGPGLEADAVVVGPRFRPRAEPFLELGLQVTPHATGLGDVIEVDAMGATGVPGLYAAGNVTDPGLQVLHAAAHGNRVGAMVSFDLADDDLRSAARPSGNQADWDHRYSGEPLWSGNPNGTLVNQVSDLAPGRALDVGAGEGADALWLAERGWDVTASDISTRGLDRIAAEAARRGLPVECRRGDANAREPFGVAAFDLVSAQYASIPRTPDDRAVANLLTAVAPGGTLLVVSHDLDAMQAAMAGHGHGRPFDPEAYVRVDDFAAALADSAEWEVELFEKRPRPPGAASASHHVDDLVLRARRNPAS